MSDLDPTPTAPAREFNPLEAVVGVITRPVPTMRAIALARPWLIALALFIIIQVVSGLAGLTTPLATDMQDLPPEMQDVMRPWLELARNPVALLGGALVLGPLGLLIGAGIIYLVARMLGGQGPFSGLFSTLAYAAVPTLLVAPITVVLNLLGPALAALSGLLGFAVGIWTIVLYVIAIQESMALTTGRAIAALLIPLVVVVLLICLVAVVIGVLIASALGGAGA